MKIDTGIAWAAVDKWGDVITVEPLRRGAIKYAVIAYDHNAYRAAQDKAEDGRIFLGDTLTEQERKAWRRLKRSYGIRVTKVRVEETTA